MKKYVNFLCVMILALMLVDLVYELFLTSGDTVITADLDSFSLGSLLFLLFILLVIIGAAIVCIVSFIKFILNVNRNEVFTRKNISLLRKYGVCSLLVGVCIIYISIIMNIALEEAVTDGFDTIGEGLFSLLMGEVFGIGLNLQEGKK